MHYDSGKSFPKPSVPWRDALGTGLGCLGLWVSLSGPGLAQSIALDHPIQRSDKLSTAELPMGAIETEEQIMLPPPEDVPEEILRTEIIFEARSPMDGTSLSAADYAQLQTDLAASQTTLTLSDGIREAILLLQIRHSLKPLIPFLP